MLGRTIDKSVPVRMYFSNHFGAARLSSIGYSVESELYNEGERGVFWRHVAMGIRGFYS